MIDKESKNAWRSSEKKETVPIVKSKINRSCSQIVLVMNWWMCKHPHANYTTIFQSEVTEDMLR